MTEKTTNLVQEFGKAVQQNPFSAALIGMGAVWLLASRGNPVSFANTVREKAVNAASDAAERVKGAAAEYADDVPELATDTLGNLRDNVSELFRTQPLALGAIGLAVGAVVAASLPSTEIESEYLGETSSTVRKTVEEIAGQAMEKATERGSQVADAMMEEAKQQGLTKDGVKAAAGEIADSVKAVAQAARPKGQ
jgi:hypothetical protein